MVKPLFRRTSKLTALTAAVMATTVGAALGATFDTGTFGPSSGGGYGRVSGTVSWVSVKAFDYNVNVQDICPGDGQGIGFLFIMKEIGNGTVFSQQKGADTDGCGNGFRQFTDRQTWPGNLKWAEVQPCYTQDGECSVIPIDYVHKTMYNPYTTN